MVLNKRFLAHSAALSANLIYGANYSIAKGIMPEYIKPFGFIVIRVLFTAFVFWIAGLFFKKEKLESSDNLKLFFCAVFGVAINQLLFFKGLDLTAPINGARMMTTNPIMVLIAASMIVGERITINKINAAPSSAESYNGIDIISP